MPHRTLCLTLALLAAACAGTDGTNSSQQAGASRSGAAAAPPADPAQASDADEGAHQRQQDLQVCDASALESWKGRPYSAVNDAALMQGSNSAELRVIRPGESIAMDFRTDRLTVELDEAGRIVVVRCG